MERVEVASAFRNRHDSRFWIFVTSVLVGRIWIGGFLADSTGGSNPARLFDESIAGILARQHSRPAGRLSYAGANGYADLEGG